MNQHAVRSFSIALEMFPKALTENSGVNGTKVDNKLHLTYKAGNKYEGSNLDLEQPATVDVVKNKIFDLCAIKNC